VKFFFLVIFFLLPLNSNAEWIKLFSGKNGTDFFFQSDSLSQDKNVRFVKILINYDNENEHGDISIVVQREIKCNELMYKDTNKKFYKKKLGKGDESRGSGEIKNSKWVYFPPGSSGGEMIKIICSLKLN